MLKRNICVLLLILASSAAAAFAQKTYTPKQNSPERTAILDALRVPVSKELKQKVSFIAENFKVQGNWAFIGGQARNTSGGKPDWQITEYQKRIDVDAFEDNLFALLKKTGGKWRIVTYMIGCTDVCYLNWSRDYRAPKAILQ